MWCISINTGCEEILIITQYGIAIEEILIITQHGIAILWNNNAICTDKLNLNHKVLSDAVHIVVTMVTKQQLMVAISCCNMVGALTSTLS